jgi:hypothetical protein
MPASKVLTPAPEEEVRKDPRPLLVVLIVLCAIFVVTYALRLDERDRVEAAIVAQKAANAAAITRGAELREILTQVTRPAYLDIIIRQFLGMGKDGDTRLVPVDAPGLATAAPVPLLETAPRYSGPVWRQWLTLFSPRPNAPPAPSTP